MSAGRVHIDGIVGGLQKLLEVKNDEIHGLREQVGRLNKRLGWARVKEGFYIFTIVVLGLMVCLCFLTLAVL